MLPFKGQVAILFFCMIIIFVQFMIYSHADWPEEQFSGLCHVNIATDESGKLVTEMQCNGENVDMEKYQVSYLLKALTEQREPAILCTKMQTRYLREVTWTCEIDPDNENEEDEKV